MALLMSGSAVLLISCRGERESAQVDTENLITQQVDSLTRLTSEDGRKAYRFTTPLLESYDLAAEPYTEFRYGINIETYKKDSTGVVESTLTANYAIFWSRQELWEARGNVVAVNAEGQVLESQELFWNQRTKKIYSTVDTKITQGTDVIIGVGFESDESMNDFTFRRPRGKVTVDTEPTRLDSTAGAPAGPEEAATGPGGAAPAPAVTAGSTATPAATPAGTAASPASPAGTGTSPARPSHPTRRSRPAPSGYCIDEKNVAQCCTL